MPENSLKPTIFVISDSTGETASRAAKVALEQFFEVTARERRFPNVRSKAEVEEHIRAAAREKAFVVYTLVADELRAAAKEAAAELRVPAVDILKELLPRLGKWLKLEPHEEPGHKLDEGYYSRVAAVDFAQQHDDGQRLHELEKAEIVILGLSRTSKTPVTHEIARKGLRAANVPLALELEPPRQIFSLDPKRVFVLEMRPDRLRAIRLTRINTSLGAHATTYADIEHIEDEIKMVRQLAMRNPDWTRIDVTNRAIEETAALIVRSYQDRFNGH